jgi:tRNA G18 (ribose-2'-O)-methylase SpoU
VEHGEQVSLVQDFARLTDVQWRKSFEAEHGLFIAEGQLTIERALAAGYCLRHVLTSEKWLGALLSLGIEAKHITVCPEAEMESLTGFHVHRGALASFERKALLSIAEVCETAQRVVVLDGLVDHENVGTIVRSAVGLGWNSIVLTETSADPFYRRSIKTSMGAVFGARISVATSTQTLHQLKRLDVLQIGLSPSGSVPLQEVKPSTTNRIALWFGSEGSGLGSEVLEEVDATVSVPMSHGVDSLNVAACAAICMWHLQAN